MRTTWARWLVIAFALAALVAAAVVWNQSLPKASAVTAVAGSTGPSPRIFVKFTGQKSGFIRGDVGTRVLGYSPSIANLIPVYGVTHSIISPRDPQSGLPTGQRMHKPITLTIDWSKASPALYNVLCTNENLTSVDITYYKTTSLGYRPYATIKLTNANIAAIDEASPPGSVLPVNTADKAGVLEKHTEKVTLTYQSIKWTDVSSGVTATDSWEAAF